MSSERVFHHRQPPSKSVATLPWALKHQRQFLAWRLRDHLGSPWDGGWAEGGAQGNLLRRELFRFQLERRTPEIAAPTASPLLTTVGALQRDDSVKTSASSSDWKDVEDGQMVRASGHLSWLAFKKEVSLVSDSGLVVLQIAMFLLRIFLDLTEIPCFRLERWLRG